jgi:hypothetical protein
MPVSSTTHYPRLATHCYLSLRLPLQQLRNFFNLLRPPVHLHRENFRSHRLVDLLLQFTRQLIQPIHSSTKLFFVLLQRYSSRALRIRFVRLRLRWILRLCRRRRCWKGIALSLHCNDGAIRNKTTTRPCGQRHQEPAPRFPHCPLLNRRSPLVPILSLVPQVGSANLQTAGDIWERTSEHSALNFPRVT